MILSPMTTQFESVLLEQQLTDVASIFADPDFCDETPLYSRYQQVDFLKQYGDPNLLLLELALDYLDRVASALRGGESKRFIAITIISDDDGEHIVPQIFVCNGDARQRFATLRITVPSSELGKHVAELVRQARPDDFDVFEDCTTVPGDVRIFIGYRASPHGFATLADFAGARSTQG